MGAEDQVIAARKSEQTKKILIENDLNKNLGKIFGKANFGQLTNLFKKLRETTKVTF